MSRRRALWLAACVAAPWALAAVWTFLDRHVHVVDRAIRALDAWTKRRESKSSAATLTPQRTEPAWMTPRPSQR